MNRGSDYIPLEDRPVVYDGGNWRQELEQAKKDGAGWQPITQSVIGSWAAPRPKPEIIWDGPRPRGEMPNDFPEIPNDFPRNPWLEDRAKIADTYRQSLGRDATDDELSKWMSGQFGHGQAGNIAPILDAIRNSGEARGRATAPAPGPAAGNATPSPTPTTPAPTTPNPSAPNAAPYTGFTPKYAMEGFNFAREQNPGKSAKDAFAMLANQAPPPPLQDKAALGAWFKQYIEPGMNSLGHKVSSVDGDKFSYANHEGAFTVDFGRGAGAQGGALAWQADPADAATRQRYASGGSNAAAPAASASAQAPQVPVNNAPAASSDLMAQILAALSDQNNPDALDPQAQMQAALR